MEQLTLDKAATEYSLDCFVNNPEISVKNVFIAGAEWQKEKVAAILRLVSLFTNNPPSELFEIIHYKDKFTELLKLL